MKEKKDLSIQVLHIQSWGRPAPRGRGDPHTALRCPVSKERDGFPKGEAARRCAVSGAGLTLSRLKGIASPVGEIFRKKTDEGFSRASRGGLPPPFSRARPRAPATHYPLNSSPFSLLQGPARRNRRAGRAHARQPRTPPSILLPSPYSASGHALPSPFFSLFPTSGSRTAESPRGARPRAPSTHYPLLPPPYSLLIVI